MYIRDYTLKFLSKQASIAQLRQFCFLILMTSHIFVDQDKTPIGRNVGQTELVFIN